jgi:LysM repeat protein
LGLLALLAALGPLANIASAAGTYKVEPGDSLFSIAIRYGTTVDAIMTANGLTSRSIIYVGQVLTIPSASAGQASNPSSQPGGGSYVVQPGDTLSGIAVRFGTTTAAIMQANGLGSTAIYAGQRLTIPSGNQAPPPQPAPPTATPRPQPQPQPQPQPDPSGSYTVRSGDTLIGLANKFGVSRDALASANGISPSSLLYVGQVLKVPSGQPAPQPTSQPAPAQPTPTANTQPSGGNKSVKYTVQPGDNLSSIAARFGTSVDNLIALNGLGDRNFLRSGQVLTISKGDDGGPNPPGDTATPTPSTPTPEPTPPMGQFGIKWVDVNLTSQTMIAYEGQVPVFTSVVSTGVPRHATVEGTYRIYARYRVTKMEGGQGSEYYYIPDVPYTMYFYSGYALHGAYWHNNFGRPTSHGCVNLPVDAAKWMFDWAPIGTLVVTHK